MLGKLPARITDSCMYSPMPGLRARSSMAVFFGAARRIKSSHWSSQKFRTVLLRALRGGGPVRVHPQGRGILVAHCCRVGSNQPGPPNFIFWRFEFIWGAFCFLFFFFFFDSQRVVRFWRYSKGGGWSDCWFMGSGFGVMKRRGSIWCA